MKTHIIIAVLLTQLAARGQDTIGKHYDLAKVVTIVALEEKYPASSSEYQYFAPLKTRFSEAEDVAQARLWIRDAQVEDSVGPFIGHLCHFAMLNSDKDVIAMGSILNDACLCSIHGAHRDKKGRIVADYGKNSFGFTSRPLVKAFYKRLQAQDPEHMKALTELYGKKESALEHLLFDETNANKTAPLPTGINPTTSTPTPRP